MDIRLTEPEREALALFLDAIAMSEVVRIMTNLKGQTHPDTARIVQVVRRIQEEVIHQPPKLRHPKSKAALLSTTRARF